MNYKPFSGLWWGLMLVVTTCSSKPCSRLDFPSLEGNSHNDSASVITLTVQENITLSLNFTILDDGCDTEDVRRIHVTKTDINHPDSHALPVCQLLHSQTGRCRKPYRSSKCTCDPETGVYLLKYKADRQDNTMWNWLIDDRRAQQIRFNVLYSANVGSLTLGPSSPQSQYLMHEGEPLDVACAWENGNPPVTARLLDRHGVDMEGGIYSSGQIRYRFPAVGCQDAGLIRCEAPGASHNKTAMLLVRSSPCFPDAPETNHTVADGQNMELTLSVRASSTEVKGCKIKKVPHETDGSDGVNSTGASFSAEATMIVDCMRFSRLHGSPPDLSLTLSLANVQKEDEGHWMLELTNDVGTGRTDFHIHVVQVKTMTQTGRSDDVLQNSTVLAVFITGGVVLLAIIVAVGVVVCVNRGRISKHQLPAEEKLKEFRALPKAPVDEDDTADTVSQLSVHVYEEVLDDAAVTGNKRTDVMQSVPVPCKKRTKRPAAAAASSLRPTKNTDKHPRSNKGEKTSLSSPREHFVQKTPSSQSGSAFQAAKDTRKTSANDVKPKDHQSDHHKQKSLPSDYLNPTFHRRGDRSDSGFHPSPHSASDANSLDTKSKGSLDLPSDYLTPAFTPRTVLQDRSLRSAPEQQTASSEDDDGYLCPIQESKTSASRPPPTSSLGKETQGDSDDKLCLSASTSHALKTPFQCSLQTGEVHGYLTPTAHPKEGSAVSSEHSPFKGPKAKMNDCLSMTSPKSEKSLTSLDMDLHPAAPEKPTALKA